MKVSIVIPTYKRVDYLDRLLISIEAQTFKEYEVIVVDDNSPNIKEYEPIVEKFKNIFKEFKFITKKENSGAPHSRNIGIKEAKYDLIALVDDDDEWLPTKLEKQVEIFEVSSKKVGIVYTWTKAINENRDMIYENKSAKRGRQIDAILKECFMISASIMVRKSAILDAGLFDESFPSCQDWDMWTRILKKYDCDYVPEILTLYNKHSLDSIGLSKKSLIGYKKYYIKYLFLALIELSFSDFFKYLKSLIGTIRKINNEKN